MTLSSRPQQWGGQTVRSAADIQRILSGQQPGNQWTAYGGAGNSRGGYGQTGAPQQGAFNNIHSGSGQTPPAQSNQFPGGRTFQGQLGIGGPLGQGGSGGGLPYQSAGFNPNGGGYMPGQGGSAGAPMGGQNRSSGSGGGFGTMGWGGGPSQGGGAPNQDWQNRYGGGSQGGGSNPYQSPPIIPQQGGGMGSQGGSQSSGGFGGNIPPMGNTGGGMPSQGGSGGMGTSPGGSLPFQTPGINDGKATKPASWTQRYGANAPSQGTNGPQINVASQGGASAINQRLGQAFQNRSLTPQPGGSGGTTFDQGKYTAPASSPARSAVSAPVSNNNPLTGGRQVTAPEQVRSSGGNISGGGSLPGTGPTDWGKAGIKHSDQRFQTLQNSGANSSRTMHGTTSGLRSTSSPSNPNQGVHSQGVKSSAQNAQDISRLLGMGLGNQYSGPGSSGGQMTGNDSRLNRTQQGRVLGTGGSQGGYVPDLLQKAYDNARQANEDRYNQGVEGYQNMAEQLPALAGQNTQNLTSGYSSLGDAFNQNLASTSQQVLGGMGGARERVLGDESNRVSALGRDYNNFLDRSETLNNIGRGQTLGGYQDRAQRNLLQREGDRDALNQGYSGRQAEGMELLRGLGDQAKENINTRYDELQTQSKAGAEQDLINRGLDNTTLRGSTLSGIQSRFNRDRDLAINDLDESIRGQLSGTYNALSGDRLGAQERGADRFSGADERLTGQSLGALQDLNRQRESINQNVLQNSLSALERGSGRLLGADVSLTGQESGALQGLGQFGLQAGLNLGQAGLGALERGQNQGVNLLQDAGRDLLGFIERRNDSYPDAGLISALSGQYGASGAGLAGSMSGVPIMAGGGYNIDPRLMGGGGYGNGQQPQQQGGNQGGIPAWARALMDQLKNQGGQGQPAPGGGGGQPAPGPVGRDQPVLPPNQDGPNQPVGGPAPPANPWADPELMTQEQYERMMMGVLGGAGQANPQVNPFEQAWGINNPLGNPLGIPAGAQQMNRDPLAINDDGSPRIRSSRRTQSRRLPGDLLIDPRTGKPMITVN